MCVEAFQLIDNHAHLQHPDLAPHLDRVLHRAASAGIRYFVCNGTCEADWPQVHKLAQNYPQVIPCFGLHPWYITQRSRDWLPFLQHYLEAVPSAVGEIGLDRWLADGDEAAQEQVFRVQLVLAKQYRRPVMVHCLRAWDWLLRVLRETQPFPAGLLIHAYGGPSELLPPLTELGAYFSFAGNVLKPRKHRQRAALLQVPRERLLLETDAPDMLPPLPFRSGPFIESTDREINEPANLPLILRGVAQILTEPEVQLAPRLWENSQRFWQNGLGLTL